MPPSFFDTHCHLTLGELGKRPDFYWQRAREAGVSRAVVIGISAATSREAADFAREREGLFAAVGIHPNETSKAGDDDLEVIAELCQRSEVVAVGESGLDTYWDHASLEDQTRFLGLHAELALEQDLPLVLHIRDAYPLAARELAPFAPRGLRGIVHCFAGQAEEVDPFLDWGWPISFSGILTYPQADNVREAARKTPLDQCLIETDAPWLAPTARKGRTNEPAFVVDTAAELARIKRISLEEIARATSRNAGRVFGV